MLDALEFLWPLVDAPDSTVAAHVVASWPAGVHQRLVAVGLLTEAERADRVLCPECQGHIEEVLVEKGPCGTRYVIACPEVYRAVVPTAALQQWSLDAAALTSALAVSLALSGRCTELLPRRLWRLGRSDWQGSSRDILLARGLHWSDAEVVRAKVVRGRKPIVFVPLRRPPDDLWRTIPPTLVLSDVATLGSAGIEIETLEVAAAIHDADAQTVSTTKLALTKEELTQVVRRQVKAESKTALTDDLLIAAYRQCGSVRKAAEFLTKQTGEEVTKDKVQNALTRAGGAAAVLNGRDSDSVVRGVVSQLRDTRGKNLAQSQLPDGE